MLENLKTIDSKDEHNKIGVCHVIITLRPFGKNGQSIYRAAQFCELPMGYINVSSMAG